MSSSVHMSRIVNTVSIQENDSLADVKRKLIKRIELAKLHRDELNVQLQKSRIYLNSVRMNYTQCQNQQQPTNINQTFELMLHKKMAYKGQLQNEILEQQYQIQRNAHKLNEIKINSTRQFGLLQQNIDTLQLQLKRNANTQFVEQLQILQNILNNNQEQLGKVMTTNEMLARKFQETVIEISDLIRIGYQVRQHFGLQQLEDIQYEKDRQQEEKEILASLRSQVDKTQSINDDQDQYYTSVYHKIKNRNIDDIYDNLWVSKVNQNRKQDKEVQSNVKQQKVHIEQQSFDNQGNFVDNEKVISNLDKCYESVDMDDMTQSSRKVRSRLSKTERPKSVTLKSDLFEGEHIIQSKRSKNVERLDILKKKPKKDKYFDNVSKSQKGKKIMSLYETFYYSLSQAEKHREKVREKAQLRLHRLNVEYEMLKEDYIRSLMQNNRQKMYQLQAKGNKKLQDIKALEQLLKKNSNK